MIITDQRPTPADLQSLRTIVNDDGPWLSLLLPTARGGPQTQEARVGLRSLVSTAQEAIDADPDPVAQETLARIAALGDDSEFWQHQELGLAIYANAEHTFLLSTPYDLSPEAAWGTARLRPVVEAALATDDVGDFAVVLFGRDRVQLFAGDSAGLTELDPGPVVATEDEMVGDPNIQQSVVGSPQGRGDATFHGHGADRPSARIHVERYVRAVVDGLAEHPQIITAPTLVLAGVEDTCSFVRSIWHDERLIEATVPGVAGRTPAHELHASATEELQRVGAARRAKSVSSYEDRQGTGRTSAQPDEILTAAQEGRVDTLFITAAEPSVGGSNVSGDPIDLAIRHTLTNSGSVLCAPEGMEIPEGCAALFRY